MSGGVDSSVAAALLLEQGYDVVGCFMRLGSPGETLDEPLMVDAGGGASAQAGAGGASACERPTLRIGHQGCCSINDADDARLVAAKLGVPFYVVNFKRDFGRIMDYFADEYLAGRTPNPCVRCNDWLKFGKLHDYAIQIGAEFVASGHYARVERDATGAWSMLRGVDHDKDQSYVLFGAPRDRLAKMLLPIGAMRKASVRDEARRRGLPVFDKPDSQEICFVPDNDYAGMVERRRPGATQPGEVRDAEGRVLGTHEGQHRFTIGQRRGVGVALGHPVYVIDKDVASNTVIVGPKEGLMASGCVCAEANWLIDDAELVAMSVARSSDAADGWRACAVKFRSKGEPMPARVRVIDAPRDVVGAARTPSWSGRDGWFEVAFDEPREAVGAGQALVVYDAPGGERVLGGGWIARAFGARS